MEAKNSFPNSLLSSSPGMKPLPLGGPREEPIKKIHGNQVPGKPKSKCLRKTRKTAGFSRGEARKRGHTVRVLLLMPDVKRQKRDDCT